MEGKYYTYILASKRNGTLYIGVTNSLINRVYQHKQKIRSDCFTSKYNIDKLVYYEIYGDIGLAIKREKDLKYWRREWKIRLIEEVNPNWDDLYLPLFELAFGQKFNLNLDPGLRQDDKEGG
jgi:putative endonuclease